MAPIAFALGLSGRQSAAPAGASAARRETAVDNTRVRNVGVSEGSWSRARTFGDTLRKTRRADGVSQDDLARRSGVDRSAISNYERGMREPNLRTIVKLANALSVHPSALLRDL